MFEMTGYCKRDRNSPSQGLIYAETRLPWFSCNTGYGLKTTHKHSD